MLLRSRYWLSCLTLTSQDRCAWINHLQSTLCSGALPHFWGQITVDSHSRSDNIDTEWTFSTSQDGLWRTMKTTCYFKGNRADRTSPSSHSREDDWWEQDEDEVIIRHQRGQHRVKIVNRKGHSTYFHQYKLLKQIDRQCETGPSIAPYGDHNIILPLFG